MKFGLGPYWIEGADSASQQEAYRNMLAQAEMAEESAFDSVWSAEAHFSEANHSPVSFVVAAALATRVQALRIGALATLGLTHPVYIAEDAATLDNISNGRAIIAAVKAARPEELAGYGVPPADALGRFQESLEVLLHAWAPQPFRFQGQHFRVPACLPENVFTHGQTTVIITPNPAQLTIPLWVAATDEDAIGQAVRLGLPILGLPYDSFARLKEKLDLYRERRGGGRPGDIVPIIRHVYVADTDEQARVDTEEPLRALYRTYHQWGVVQGEPDYAAFAPDTSIIGSVDTVIAEISRYRDTLGVNYIICQIALPGLSHDKVLLAIELFGKGIISEFRMVNFPKEIRVRSLKELPDRTPYFDNQALMKPLPGGG